MSTTTDITTLLRNTVAVQLVGCEFPLIDMHLRWVLHDFLTRTGLLRESLSVSLVAAQANYPLTFATASGIAATLLTARIGESRLVHSTLAGLPAATGTPAMCALLDAETVGVWPTPTEAATLSLLAAITISPSAALGTPTVPFVCQPFFDYIHSGVLGRLYALPDKPWTSSLVAGYHKGEYMRGIAKARIAAETGRAQGTQMWRFPRFGR